MMIRRCLALAILSCAGCLEMPTAPPAPHVTAPPPPEVTSGPVTPDQVNRNNAPQMAESLRRELDRASTAEVNEGR